jgi:hypothetical protein
MDLDLTLDPTSFFSDFMDAKKNSFFPYFFLINNHRHIIFSLKNFTICYNFALKSYFASIVSGAGLAHLTNGFGSWRPKNMRIP